MRPNELSKVYETFFSIPSMNEKIKVTLQLPLKSAFVLSKLIERALAGNTGEDAFGILDLIKTELGEDLIRLPQEIMEKTGLTEFNDRFKKLTEKS